MIGDALQDVAQVKLRIESVELGRAEQTVDGCGAFGGRVVHFDVTVVEKATERTPSRERISDGHSGI